MIPVRLMPEIMPSFPVAVVREGEDWGAANSRAAAKAAAAKAESEGGAATQGA